MCGIAGRVSYAPISESYLRAMTQVLAHRGPDDSGCVVRQAEDVTVGLGHRRLSVIDPSPSGHQPMADSNEAVWVTYNGEIYNFQELKKTLLGKGHTFRTKTDTEVLIAAYREWGVGLLDRIQGMYAFGIWDEPNRRLLLARDRTGIKPLHYTVGPQSLSFASEIKALLVDPDQGRTVNRKALDAYLTFGYIPAPETILDGICKLPPAHYLMWEDGQVRIQQYWAYPIQSDYGSASLNASMADVDRVLNGAVKRQMVSDVPLGAFLSGGIDSSLIAKAMVGDTDRDRPSAFCVRMADRDWDESSYAQSVAATLGIDLERLDVQADYERDLETIAWHLDEPFADSSAIPVYYLCQATRERVTVALSGDGGDELFAGYTRFAGEWLAGWAAKLPLQRAVDAGLSLLGRVGGADRIRRAVGPPGETLIDRYVRKSSIATREEISYLTGETPMSSIEWATRLESLSQPERPLDPIDRLTLLDIGFYLPNDMLVKVDRMSMAHSLEVRVPFLDEWVIDEAARIPPSHKLRRLKTKRVLRELASQSLPQTVVNRAKQGFGMPPSFWFSGDRLRHSQEVLLDGVANRHDLYNVGQVEHALTSDAPKNERLLFALVCLQHWQQQVLEGVRRVG